MRLVHVGHVPFRPEVGTPYHLSLALARYMPVIYINPPLSFGGWASSRRFFKSSDGVYDLDVVSVVMPGQLRFLPRRWRKKPTEWLMLPWVLRSLRGINPHSMVLWVSNSELALVLHRRLRPRLTCYHRLDDFGAMDPSLAPLERALEQIADIIFVVAPALRDQHRARGREAILLPNAVNRTLFERALDESLAVPTDLQKIPRPRVGFIGWITPRWIDIELILEIARRRPDWSLVLIGPKVSWHPISLPSNCYLIGARPYAQLPAYLKGIDVCLIPFKEGAIRDGASPLKLYEYLAAGRAVVSTPVPGLDNFEELVWCASNADEFVESIEQALGEAHNPRAQSRRTEAVAPHTWEARAHFVMEHLSRWLHDVPAPASSPSAPPAW